MGPILCIQDVKQYPGVYPLDVSSTFLAVETQNISRLCNCPLGKAKSTPVESYLVATVTVVTVIDYSNY